MKKIYTFLIILLLAISLIACTQPGIGNLDSNENDSGNADGNGQLIDNESYNIYKMAQTSGYNGSYEEWLLTIKGEDGKSAYELACELGYNGTVNEWLDMLKGKDGESIELSIQDNFIVWKKQSSSEWINLISIEQLKGERGSEIELSTNTTHVIWRYVDEEEWHNLIALDSLCSLENVSKGKSAYEIAVELGFEGTIEEWIESLKGSDGKEIEMELVGSYICWRYIGDSEWIKLFDVSLLQPGNFRETYTVTFVDVQGNVILTQEVLDGKKVQKPNIEIEGYEILDWSYGDELWSFIGYSVTENMVLIPVVNKLKGTISIVNKDQLIKYFDNYPMSSFTIDTMYDLPIPKAFSDSAVFEGWFLDSEYTKQVFSTNDLAFTENKLYAKITILIDTNLTCAEDPTLEICAEPETWTWNYNRTNFDGKGRAIVIYHHAPETIDPFDQNYSGERQKDKQEILTTIELEYNVDIQIKPYPAPWGPSRVEWLNNNIASGNVQGDIYAISSGWIPTLVSGGSIALLNNRKTGEGLFAELNYEQSAEKNKLFSIGNNVYGYSINTTHADQFLYYNQSLVDQYGLEDPATLWNEGKWDWSTFYAYIQTAQNAFDSAVTGEDQAKIYAFGGFVNDIARGMLAARGGKLIDPDAKTVLFTSTLVLETYYDLRTIWECDMWAVDSRSADVSDSFRAGNQLFTHGNLWFLTSEHRFENDQITFEISAVPYPTADGDAAARSNYSTGISYICNLYGSEYAFAIRPIENGVNGISTLVLFNILDDLMRGIRPEFSLEDMTERETYIAFLQKRIESQASVDAIMSVEDNLANYAFIDYMDVVSKSVGNASDWQGSGFCTWGMSLVTGDEDPVDILSTYRNEYQNKLNEILNG